MDTSPGVTEDLLADSGMPGCTVRLSRELLKGVQTELHKRALSPTSLRAEGVGLLFGHVDLGSICLDQMQRIEIGDLDMAALRARERLQQAATAPRIAEAGVSAGHPALLGWYVIRMGGGAPGLLDRDIDLHKASFTGSSELLLIVRPAPGQDLAVEIYSPRPGTPFSKHDHRVGCWAGSHLNALAEHITVPLQDSGNEEMFLNVYKAVDALEESESKGSLATVRKYAARLLPFVGPTPAPAAQDSSFGMTVKCLWESMNTKMSQVAVTPAVSQLEWTLPSKPLAVCIDGQALQTIQRTILQEQTRQPGFCVGGLLLGTRSRSSGWQFTIQRHVPVREWDESRGGAPFVTEEQSRTLKTLAYWPSDLIPIGFYRTCRDIDGKSAARTGDALVLRRNLLEADKSVLSSCFTPGSAISISLQLDAATLQPGASVLWEDGNLYELVPKRSSQPGPALKTTALAVAAPSSSAEAAGQLQRVTPQHSMTPAGPQAAPGQTSSLRIATWVLGTILVSLLTYICAHLYIKPLLIKIATEAQPQSEAPKPGPAAVSVAAQDDILSLRIHPRGDGAFEVSWNPRSPAVQSAISGTLWMTDSAHFSRAIHLSADDLQTGRLMYIPVASDLTFHLEVTDRAGHETTQWIRVLNDARVEGKKKIGGAVKSGLPARTQSAASPAENAGSGSSAAVFTPSSSPAGSSVEPNPGNRAPLLARIDAPAVGLQAAAATPADVQKLLNSMPLPNPPSRLESREPSKIPAQPEAASQLKSQPSVSAAARKSTTVANPARVLFQYVPSPRLRAGEPAELLVPVLAQINNAGTVVGATLASSDKQIPRHLAEFAVNAARKWRFSPATINGTPVASSMTIQFHFTTSR